MREATSRNPFVLVLNRGGKYIEVKRRFRTLDDACDYGNIQMQSFLKNDTPKADGYCVINWDEYKIELYDGDFPTSGVFAKDLYDNSPTFSTYTIYPNGSRNYSRITDTQNESKRSGNDMKLRINESTLKESYVSDLIADMSVAGYHVKSIGFGSDTLDFENRNGDVLSFYDWAEVKDWVDNGTLPSKNREEYIAKIRNEKEKIRKTLLSTESMKRNKRTTNK